MNIIVELKTDAGQLIGLMTVPPKDFKTGSKGYFTSGKVEVEGKTVRSMYAPFSFRVKSYNKKPDRKFNLALRIRNKEVYIVKLDKKE